MPSTTKEVITMVCDYLDSRNITHSTHQAGAEGWHQVAHQATGKVRGPGSAAVRGPGTRQCGFHSREPYSDG